MEIKALDVFGSGVHFRFVCGNCKKDVEDTDKFCWNCGKKLEHLNRVVSIADVASILTAVFKGNPLPKTKLKEKPKEDVGLVEDNKNPSPDFDALKQSCPRCKSKKGGCEFLQENGECHGIVCPTYPPQYQKCVYERN
ncbi:MAG: hypothetical protein J6Q22_10675 [Prevotella sp.]|nr:hypothetical protein [Prevotella sp.]